jgi:hypothetical protein
MRDYSVVVSIDDRVHIGNIVAVVVDEDAEIIDGIFIVRQDRTLNDWLFEWLNDLLDFFWQTLQVVVDLFFIKLERLQLFENCCAKIKKKELLFAIQS